MTATSHKPTKKPRKTNKIETEMGYDSYRQKQTKTNNKVLTVTGYDRYGDKTTVTNKENKYDLISYRI